MYKVKNIDRNVVKDFGLQWVFLNKMLTMKNIKIILIHILNYFLGNQFQKTQ